MGRTSTNGLKLRKKNIRLNSRKCFIMVRSGRQWGNLSGEVRGSPITEMSRDGPRSQGTGALLESPPWSPSGGAIPMGMCVTPSCWRSGEEFQVPWQLSCCLPPSSKVQDEPGELSHSQPEICPSCSLLQRKTEAV